MEDCFKCRMRENSNIIQSLLNLVWNFWDHPLEVLFSGYVRVYTAINLRLLPLDIFAFLVGIAKIGIRSNMTCSRPWYVARNKHGVCCKRGAIYARYAVEGRNLFQRTLRLGQYPGVIPSLCASRIKTFPVNTLRLTYVLFSLTMHVHGCKASFNLFM